MNLIPVDNDDTSFLDSDEVDDIDKAVYLGLQGKTDEAYQLLINYPDQNHPAVLFNLGWYDIYHGKLSKGMRRLDAGRTVNAFGGPPLPGTLWKNQSLVNKTVLFNCEGGLGDQIAYVRFARDFVDRGAKVIVACEYPVAKFFNRNGFITVSNDIRTISKVYYDYWVPSMSVAHMLDYEYENLSGKAYLDAEIKHLWTPADTNAPLGSHADPSALKVGLRWSGNPHFDHESFRRFPKEYMHDMLSIEGISFYSLQKDDNLVDNLPLVDLRNQMYDFNETASIIKNLDLVITSCTSIAHCAGALGIETWIIIPILPYYMWALKGDTTPWYDSVRLYRQTKLGDWSEPFARVKNDLITKVRKNS